MKIVTVIGARPQFIKASTVSRAIAQYNDIGKTSAEKIQEIMVHTGQHYDDNMSKIFFDELEITKPDYNLGIGSASHGKQTGMMLEAIEAVLVNEQPDWVLVYGDTNSTLAGALAASKLHIPVAHVEAGLRSFNKNMPEEINRILTDHISDMLFAPTKTAVQNLKNEGISKEKVHLVGDVMYDAALFYAPKAEEASNILEQIDIVPKSYILATIHRAENTDDIGRLKAIFGGLAAATTHLPVVMPLHPRTHLILEKLGLLKNVSQCIHVTEPVGYLDMILLEKNSRLIVTDSGGVQKEAFFFRVPCVTLREETEWVELVDAGWNRIVKPTDEIEVNKGIIDLIKRNNLDDNFDLYGNGKAAQSIIQILTNK